MRRGAAGGCGIACAAACRCLTPRSAALPLPTHRPGAPGHPGHSGALPHAPAPLPSLPGAGGEGLLTAAALMLLACSRLPALFPVVVPRCLQPRKAGGLQQGGGMVPRWRRACAGVAGAPNRVPPPSPRLPVWCLQRRPLRSGCGLLGSWHSLNDVRGRNAGPSPPTSRSRPSDPGLGALCTHFVGLGLFEGLIAAAWRRGRP